MNFLHCFLLVLFVLISFIPAESSDPLACPCVSNNKTDGDPQISKNIDNLLRALVSRTNETGFVSTQYGENETRVYGLAQCRGDVPKDECWVCIQEAAEAIRGSGCCPTQSNARIFYDFCLLRYATRSFAGDVDTFGVVYFNVNKVTHSQGFNSRLSALMNNITSEVFNPVLTWLGKGKTAIPMEKSTNLSSSTIYALVQCTRDQSNMECKQCLTEARENLDKVCSNRRGCRVVYSTCYLRYETYQFFYPLDTNVSSVRGSGNYEPVVAVGA